jgi:hypothetical protein
MKHYKCSILMVNFILALEGFTIRNEEKSLMNHTINLEHKQNMLINQSTIADIFLKKKDLDEFKAHHPLEKHYKTTQIIIGSSSLFTENAFIFYTLLIIVGVLLSILLAALCIFLFYIQFSNCR